MFSLSMSVFLRVIPVSSFFAAGLRISLILLSISLDYLTGDGLGFSVFSSSKSSGRYSLLCLMFFMDSDSSKSPAGLFLKPVCTVLYMVLVTKLWFTLGLDFCLSFCGAEDYL